MRGTRGYDEWVIVRVVTDQGVEGVGEGFTWAGKAAPIRSRIESIGEAIAGGPLEKCYNKEHMFSRPTFARGKNNLGPAIHTLMTKKRKNAKQKQQSTASPRILGTETPAHFV